MPEPLEDIEIAIIRSVRSGGITEVPPENQDSGHTAWLVDKGFLKLESDVLVVTELGRLALAEHDDH